MALANWKNIFLVSTVQVLSQSVFYAQGILSAQEVTIEPPEECWFSACSPLAYAAIQHLSGAWWRRLIGGRGNRLGIMIGSTIVGIAVAVSAFQSTFYGHVVYSTLGGVGMGLVVSQLKLMKSLTGNKVSPWGVGVSGIGLAFWPLFACLFARSHGPRLALLPLAGIALHAVPAAQLLRPVADADDESVRDDGTEDCEPVRSMRVLPDVKLTRGQYRLTYQQTEPEMQRVRPPYCVEILPGIPEEGEHEDDHHLHREVAKATTELAEDPKDKCAWESEYEILPAKNVVNSAKVKVPFSYPIFIATTLLRLGDVLSLCIVVSVVPTFAGYLMPHLRIQEKAFLVSLCGFSRILAEFPLLAHYRSSNKANLVLLAGPILASVGLYLVWHSATLDAITMASVGLGIGNGAAAAALHILTPIESPGADDAADIIIGVVLLATVPLARILIMGHAIQEYFLLAAGVYAMASIAWIINFFF